MSVPIGKVADEIRALLGKYMIRRVKDDVPDLEIPEKSVVNVYHGLSKVQTDLYRAILSRNHGRLLPATMARMICRILFEHYDSQRHESDESAIIDEHSHAIA
jgi:SNF2 family DNA or RNA helicase